MAISQENFYFSVKLKMTMRYLYFLGSTQSTAMLATLDQLHDMAIPKAKNQTNGGIMQKVFEIFTHENVCNLKQSPQQYLLRLYTLIALTDIKGYMMVQFSYAGEYFDFTKKNM